MAKIVVTEAYFNNLIQLKKSATHLSLLKDGLDKRSENKLTNLENQNGLYETYKRITDLFDGYGEILEKEVKALKQAGINQRNIDTTYSRRNH
ncbi:MAG: hypothetical protein LBM27_00400 [Lactobacillaceae bacterium]|jgi:septation ring formation regulator EzrA|nr:hypothetical protein [Lactobacillaceae bacterium]